MANYFSPTVVQPKIPFENITPLELHFLCAIFSAEKNDSNNGSWYFFAEESIPVSINLNVKNIKDIICQYEIGVESLEENYKTFLTDTSKFSDDDSHTLEINKSFLIELFQRIIKRSETINQIDIVTSYICDKMRSDGFGGKRLIILCDSWCEIDTDIAPSADLFNDDVTIMFEKLINLNKSLHTCLNGFVESVRLTSGKTYPWPELEVVNEEYNSLDIDRIANLLSKNNPETK